MNPDFDAFIELLNSHGVKYLVVGGHAVAFHGYPRYTKDLDVWVEVSLENAQKILDVLQDFGFGKAGATLEHFTEAGRVVGMGVPPRRIDILTSADGIAFDECFAVRETIQVGQVSIALIDKRHLIINKEAAGRPQDLADAAALRGESPRRRKKI